MKFNTVGPLLTGITSPEYACLSRCRSRIGLKVRPYLLCKVPYQTLYWDLTSRHGIELNSHVSHRSCLNFWRGINTTYSWYIYSVEDKWLGPLWPINLSIIAIRPFGTHGWINYMRLLHIIRSYSIHRAKRHCHMWFLDQFEGYATCLG